MTFDKRKITNGFAWTAIERFAVMATQFVLGILLARLIPPTEYGILGILMVFISVSEVFVDSGFGNAIIYFNNLEKKDLSTAFTFNVGVGFFFYVLLFLLSPLIENFFALSNLSLYIKVSALALVLNSIIVVPTAIIKVKLNFKSIAVANITATVISGIVGFTMAYMGAGIWALIAQLLSRSTMQVLILTILCHWLPSIYISKQSFLKLYRYGINLFGASCITRILDEGTQFFIGKVLTPFNLGIYTRGNQFASLPGTVLGAVINTVIFPSLSSLKDDVERFDRVYRKAIVMQAVLTTPIFLFLAMCSEPLIKILITEKWIAAVPIMQILCVGRVLSPVSNITEQMLNANGRSDLFLKQQIVKVVVKFTFVVAALRFGIIAVALADMIYTWSRFFITNYFARNVNKYHTFKQLKDISPFIASAVIAGLLGYVAVYIFHNDFIRLTTSLFVSCSLYWLLVSRVFKKGELNEMLEKLYQTFKLKIS